MIGKLMLNDELDGACEEVTWRDLRWWPRICLGLRKNTNSFRIAGLLAET